MVSNENKIKELEGKLKELIRELDNKAEVILEMSKDLDSYRNKLKEKDKEIERLNISLDLAEQCNKGFDKGNNLLHQLKQQVKQKDKEWTEKIEKLINNYVIICPKCKFTFSTPETPLLIDEDYTECNCGLSNSLLKSFLKLDKEEVGISGICKTKPISNSVSRRSGLSSSKNSKKDKV